MTRPSVGQTLTSRPARVGALSIAAAAIGFLFAGALSQGASAIGTGAKAAQSESCQMAGVWLDPENRQALDPAAMLSQTAGPGIVLLGESHTSKEDHLWQAQALAGLYAHHPQIIIGFEAFPREVQPILDDWSKGKLSEEDFLKTVNWNEVWGYDADLYMPLFNFVRQNRLPMKALNVDRTLVSRVGREGWDAIAVDDREGLGDPADASADYREALAKVYAAKAARSHEMPVGEAASAAGKTLPSLEAILEDPGFNRFVEAQLTWDRAMAEALATAAGEEPEALVVGILGRGHVEHGFGVAHQLADLGAARVSSFLPVRTGAACDSLEATVADAVYLVDERQDDRAAPERPRLGVFIETANDGGVRLIEIVDGSIAAATELSAGDIIVEAAGVELETSSDLVEVVSRQAPGTWLPLGVLRDGDRLELVAKFPPKADSQP